MSVHGIQHLTCLYSISIPLMLTSTLLRVIPPPMPAAFTVPLKHQISWDSLCIVQFPLSALHVLFSTKIQTGWVQVCVWLGITFSPFKVEG